jgi:hypothetical protein
LIRIGVPKLWYVDTGLILERDLAPRAGLDFVGKHTNLISHKPGNWIFLWKACEDAKPLIADHAQWAVMRLNPGADLRPLGFSVSRLSPNVTCHTR